MPALLRFALTAVTLVGVTASPVLLAVLAPHAGGDEAPVVAVLAITAMWLAPMTAGLLVSAWSTPDQDGRRRMRRAIVVCGLVALGGAVLLIGAATAERIPLPVAVLLAAVALGAFPLSVALGRAARRIEDRRDAAEWRGGELEEVLTDLDRGRRRGAYGSAIGVALGIGLAIALDRLSDGDPDSVPTLVGFVVSAAALGAFAGRMSVSFRIGRRTRELLGSDFTTARRTGRIIRGKDAPDSPEEADRAARYARLALRTIPYQSWSSALIIVSIVVNQIPNLVDDRLTAIRWFTFGTAFVALAVLLPVQAVQLRRIRSYAAEHPIPVAT